MVNYYDIPLKRCLHTMLLQDPNFAASEEMLEDQPLLRQGAARFTVFFTGFSGSGKSTIANALMVKLMEMGGRPVTLLDGGIVRKNLSSELGFSKEHHDLNIRRIGYVASEITKNGGIAICAPIAPYAATRRAVREDIEAFGAFVEVDNCTHRVLLKLESMGLISGNTF